MNLFSLILAVTLFVSPSLAQPMYMPISETHVDVRSTEDSGLVDISGAIDGLFRLISSFNPLATGECPESGCPPPPPPDPEEDDLDWSSFPTYWCGDNTNYNDQCAPIVPVGEPFDISAITTYSGLPLVVTVETPTNCSYESGAVTVFKETNAIAEGFGYEPYLYIDSPNACKLALSTVGTDEWLPITNAYLTLIAGTPQHVEITISRDGIQRGPDEPARVGDTVIVRTWFESGIRIRGGGSFSLGDGNYRHTVPSCRTIVESVGGVMVFDMNVEPGGASCVGEFVIPEPDLAMRERLVSEETGCQEGYGEGDYFDSVWDLAFYIVAIPELRARGRANRLPLPAYVDAERETSVPNSCYAASTPWVRLVNRQGINSAVFLQSFEVREGDRAAHSFSSSDTGMISWDLRDWGADQFTLNSDWTLPLQNLRDYVDWLGTRCVSDLSMFLRFGEDIWSDAQQYWTVVVPDKRCTEITLHVPGPMPADLAGDVSGNGTLYMVIGGTQLYSSFELAKSDESPRVDGAAAVLFSDVNKARFVNEGSRWAPEFYVGTGETCDLVVRNVDHRDPRTFAARSDPRGICTFDIAWEDLPSDAPYYPEGARQRNYELSTSRLGQTETGYTSFSNYLITVVPPELPDFSSVSVQEDESLSFTINPGDVPLVEVQVELTDGVAPTSSGDSETVRVSSVRSASEPSIETCDIEAVTADGEAIFMGGEEFDEISVLCPEGYDPDEIIVTSMNAAGAIASSRLADSLEPPTTLGSLRIAGASRVDGSLRIDSGFSWRGATPEFQWYRCDRTVATLTESETPPVGCEEVEGSDSRTRYLDESDYRTFSLVSVTLVNEHGSQTLFSPTTSRIVGTAPRVWGDAPSIGGTTALRKVLLANAGEWRGWPEPSIKYAWLRCRRPGPATTSFPSGCRVIPRSSQSVYRLGAGDLRTFVRVAITVRNEYGSTTYYSQATERVGRR